MKNYNTILNFYLFLCACGESVFVFKKNHIQYTKKHTTGNGMEKCRTVEMSRYLLLFLFVDFSFFFVFHILFNSVSKLLVYIIFLGFRILFIFEKTVWQKIDRFKIDKFQISNNVMVCKYYACTFRMVSTSFCLHCF